MSDDATEAQDAASSRSELAYQELRDLVISGKWKPNARLTDAELTKLLDVSRGTVRSVTARLVQEGYLTSEPHRGVRTREFSIEEAVDILEAREVLEAALAAKAAVSATDAELDELTEICERMAIADRDKVATVYSGLNRSFHQHVREFARQPTLTAFVESLHYPLVMRQYRDLTREHPRKNSLSEHRAILYALKTRNAEAAGAAMRHHVASARRALQMNTDRQDAEATTAMSG